MKKTIGICLFAAILLVVSVCALLLGQSFSAEEPKAEDRIDVAGDETATEEPLLLESMRVQENFLYILREEDGMLVVYENDGETLLLETNIDVRHFPEDARKLLTEGIKIQDERELYDLLESYSS